MNLLAPFRAFLVNDPDHAPFGLSWLRGMTPARLGLVELVCLVFAFRQGSDNFLALPWQKELLDNVAFTQVQLAASLPMLVLVALAERHTGASTAGRRVAALSLAVGVGAAAYALVILVAFNLFFGGQVGDPRNAWQSLQVASLLAFVGYFLRALLMGGLLTAVLYLVAREVAVAAALHATQITSIALQKQMAEAQVHMLQAQIEPHFLFNTLAHIKHLYLTDPGKGKSMLHNLSAYLRAALPQMRDSHSTLGRELSLTLAYLHVQQARMAERLEVSIAVPEELFGAELPPMMLSTLAENAVKHGIAPLPQGGTIRIAAAREGSRLRVTVADNGIGFQGVAGSGVGLANTRARLAALYGSHGMLTFAANPVRGVTVCIDLPYGVRRPEDVAA